MYQIKLLQQEVRRQNKLIRYLKDLVKDLKKKKLIEREAEENRQF